MYNAGVSITKTADEWLFTGYVDPFLSLENLLSKFNKNVKIPYDRRNNRATYDGHFNVFTGADDIRKMGEIHTWNYKKHSRIFEGECGQVTGSMGEFFPPILTPQDTLWLFVPNICRAVPFDYTESVQIHNVNAHKPFDGVQRAFRPLMWGEHRVRVPPEMAEGMGGTPPPTIPPGMDGPRPPTMFNPMTPALPQGLKPKKKWEVKDPMKKANWKAILPHNISEKSFCVKCQEDKLVSEDLLAEFSAKFSSKPIKKEPKNSVDKAATLSKKNVDLKYLPPPEQLKRLQDIKAKGESLPPVEQFAATIGNV
uniref:Uncharacterized protein n=1 Tax=Glossina palpalis gambiensis TaxID=67801 RepID=A0A1B0C4Z0_9MUSC